GARGTRRREHVASAFPLSVNVLPPSTDSFTGTLSGRLRYRYVMKRLPNPSKASEGSQQASVIVVRFHVRPPLNVYASMSPPALFARTTMFFVFVGFSAPA